MGNHRFQMSDIVPKSWLHKLKNMAAKPTATPQKKPTKTDPPPPTHSRKSYHFTRHRLPSSPVEKPQRYRNHSAAKYPIPTVPIPEYLFSSPEPQKIAEFRCDSILPTESSDAMASLSWSPSSGSHPNDIEIDSRSFKKEPLLPPVVTRKSQGKFRKTEALPRRGYRNGSEFSHGKKSSMVNSPIGGVRLRVNSPKIGRFQPKSTQRSVASESFAVVKSSGNPRKDFRESMMEMIVQNNMWESKDLEELLATYLSLNSDEYHDLIIKVFKQIWVDLSRRPG